nr:palindromic element RPE5 domain-containing protein [Rickettsia bellii]
MREHPRTYKDDVANFSSSSSIPTPSIQYM